MRERARWPLWASVCCGFGNPSLDVALLFGFVGKGRTLSHDTGALQGVGVRGVVCGALVVLGSAGQFDPLCTVVDVHAEPALSAWAVSAHCAGGPGTLGGVELLAIESVWNAGAVGLTVGVCAAGGDTVAKDLSGGQIDRTDASGVWVSAATGTVSTASDFNGAVWAASGIGGVYAHGGDAVEGAICTAHVAGTGVLFIDNPHWGFAAAKALRERVSTLHIDRQSPAVCAAHAAEYDGQQEWEEGAHTGTSGG